MRRIYAIVLRQFYLIRAVFHGFFLYSRGSRSTWYSGIPDQIFKYRRFARIRLRYHASRRRIVLGLLHTYYAGCHHGVLRRCWSRNFLNIFATPLTVSEYVGGLVSSSIATSMVGLGVTLFIAVAFFKLSLSVYGLMAIMFIFVLFLFGIALGIFGSALVLRFGPASEWFVWPIPALISPFAGVLYPITTCRNGCRISPTPCRFLCL